jgi:putative drug exporter of the RND superfamily
LILAGCCIAVLAVLGMKAESRLHPTSLSVGGTESARNGALLHHYFGESEPFVILLKGPPGEVKAQGRGLVRALNRDPLATAISPWGHETMKQLRPTRRSALIFVNFRVSLNEAVKRTVPNLNELLKRRISPPVRAVQSGYASISLAIQEEAAQATQRAELIAAPLVLLVLLLVFRSAVAASIPLVFGAATVAGSRGILSLASNWLSIDAFALTAGAMMGLALGIDYTLLMVSRFREELGAGKSAVAAAKATQRTAGRTVAFAGGALLVSMVASALILPGTFLVSLAGAVVVVTGLSVALGVVVVPALLAVVGHGIDKWSIGVGRTNQEPGSGVISRVLRRPAWAVAMLTVPLALLALPALSLSVGPPTPEQLPSTNETRLNTELINKEVGPGWATPYEVLAATKQGAITSRGKLAALRKWEHDVARMNDVQAVIGPGAVRRRVEPIRKFGQRFLAQAQPGNPVAELEQLGRGLGGAAEGVAKLRTGIARTAYGAGLLSDGSQNVDRGAQSVAAGLGAATAGTDRTAKALDRFASSTHEIHTGQRRVAVGALALKFDIRDLIPRLRHSTLLPTQRLQQELTDVNRTIPHLKERADQAEGHLGAALAEFQRMASPPDDPHYSSALRAVQEAQGAIVGTELPGKDGGEASSSGLADELEAVGSDLLRANERTAHVTTGVMDRIGELEELVPLTAHLVSGLDRLERGGEGLDSGARRLARSTLALANGLPRLSDGATALSDGVEEFASGTSSLAGHLSQIYAQSQPLEPGLSEAARRSTEGGVTLRRQRRRITRLSPGLFDSGYLSLSALDGTPLDVRSRLAQAVDIDRGGQAARILVIPRYKDTAALDNRLRLSMSGLGQRIDGRAGVAGDLAELNDYADASGSRLPIVITVVSLVTFLCLVLILRAIVVPAITVLLNLLSVGVAFGVLALVSRLPTDAPIGDWGYIDTVGAVAIFAIAFGVSIDYSVFILVRMREEFDRHKDHEAAVWVGVRRTKRIITGAALMMVAVFAAFATSNLAIVSQLGLGLTVAILMDATVIRLVLLPALLLLIGERSWWLPGPLSRILPASRVT